MNCTECQELIATTAPDQLLPADANIHYERCGACRTFASDLEAVSGALSAWMAPPAPVMDLVAMEARVALDARPKLTPAVRPGIVVRLLAHPAVLAVGGAAALATGIAVAPGWLQHVAAGWVIVAGVFVSLVLVHHSRRTVAEGEPSC